MRVVVLHDRVPSQGASPDQADVLVQAETVSRALRELGHDPVTLSATLDLQSLGRELLRIHPGLVFNLVESIEGYGRLIHLAPALLDCLKIPYTGSWTNAIFLTTSKLLTKRCLRDAAVPAPHGFSPKDLGGATPFPAGPYILKSVWEHASIGLDEESVVTASHPADLLAAIRRKEAVPGGEWFAEAYIEGREFNLSLLAAGEGTQVLPPAEIRFVDYPEGKSKIVGYRAKWHATSFEYLHTVRSFDFPPEDHNLLQRLTELALRCWSLFDTRGYARVDFRVDQAGQPWVLEINANPCLAPDAGFVVAAAKAGISVAQVVDRIIGDCGIPPGNARRAESSED